jgi:hypothetical protein
MSQDVIPYGFLQLVGAGAAKGQLNLGSNE